MNQSTAVVDPHSATDPAASGPADAATTVDAAEMGELVPAELAQEVSDDDLAAELAKFELRWLDPRLLAESTRNVRVDMGDLAELEDSIAENGVQVPTLGVATGDGEYDVEIVMGHRRHRASKNVLTQRDTFSVRARLMPVLVRRDPFWDVSERTAAMIEENVHRKALTPSEEAGGYQQLELAGWSVDRIVRKTGRRRHIVEQSLILSRQAPPVRDAVDRGELSLQDMLDLQLLENDPRVMRRITEKAGTWGIRHVISEAISRRRTAEQITALTAELTSKNVTVISRPKGFPHDSREASITALRTADGERLLADEVMYQPGFAVFIEKGYTKPEVTVVCLNPEAHGFQRTGYTRYITPEERARRAAAEEAEQALRAALGDAVGVRHRFIAEKFRTAKAARALSCLALRHVLADQDRLSIGDDETLNELRASLLGADIDLDDASESHLIRMLVAKWICWQEYNLTECLRRTHFARPQAALAWLEGLAATGYEWSDAETQFHDRLAASTNPDADTDDEEYEDQEYGDEEYEDPYPEDTDEDGYALVHDPIGGVWQLLDPSGTIVTTSELPPTETAQVTGWATDILAAQHGHRVAAWHTFVDGETGTRLMAVLAPSSPRLELVDGPDDGPDEEAEPVGVTNLAA